MSLIRYTVTGRKSAPAVSHPEGTGEALVIVDIETTIAESGRAAMNNTVPHRSIVIDALERVLAEVRRWRK